jgi:hypothetical protein
MKGRGGLRDRVFAISRDLVSRSRADASADATLGRDQGARSRAASTSLPAPGGPWFVLERFAPDCVLGCVHQETLLESILLRFSMMDDVNRLMGLQEISIVCVSTEI